jgi:hypothetical protein
MALDTATATFSGQFGVATPVAKGTAITFEGLKFNGGGSTSSGKYFMSTSFEGTLDSLVFKNCLLDGYTRCLLNWSGCDPTKSGLTKLRIENCILNNFGSATYNMIWTSAPIDVIEIVDNTIYNSMSGAKPESVFSTKTAPTDNRSVKLIFKHNTYYSGSRTDKTAYSYPMFNFTSFYKGESSTVDISDNIIYCPASGFNPNYLLSSRQLVGGSINNNLIIVTRDG